MIHGRAEYPEQKQDVLDCLLLAWNKTPELRLGQLIENAVADGQDIFYLEDYALLNMIEDFVKGCERASNA